jgi:hypothetical protein
VAAARQVLKPEVIPETERRAVYGFRAESIHHSIYFVQSGLPVSLVLNLQLY